MSRSRTKSKRSATDSPFEPSSAGPPPDSELPAIWSERAIPPAILPMLDDRAVIAGSAEAMPNDPFAFIHGCAGIIASSRITYNSVVMDLAPGLRVISRTGTGVDNIDIAAATERGIVVCNDPDGPSTSTAEHTIALLLGTAKRLKVAEAALRSGRFDIFNDHDALELNGRVLGVVGLGAIGSRVARISLALGMRVLAFDPYVSDDFVASLGVERAATLVDLLRQADVVSLHVPFTSLTSKMIDAQALGQMRSGSILINTARGGVIDEGALLAALDAGHLAAAGLDVFDPEPPLPTNPLFERDDVLATPHIAAATAAGRERLWRTAIAQALQVLSGGWPDHVVNPSVRHVDV